MLNNGILANSKQCKSPPITVFEYSPSLHRTVTVTKAWLVTCVQCNPILESPVHVKQLVNSLPKQFRGKSGMRGKQEQGLGFTSWLRTQVSVGTAPVWLFTVRG